MKYEITQSVALQHLVIDFSPVLLWSGDSSKTGGCTSRVNILYTAYNIPYLAYYRCVG